MLSLEKGTQKRSPAGPKTSPGELRKPPGETPGRPPEPPATLETPEIHNPSDPLRKTTDFEAPGEQELPNVPHRPPAGVVLP